MREVILMIIIGLLKVVQAGLEPSELHENLKYNRIEAIKEHILKNLDLIEPPNVTGLQVPKEVLSRILRENVMSDHPAESHIVYVPKDARKATARKFYIFGTHTGSLTPTAIEQLYRSHFDFSQSPNYDVTEAKLWVFLKCPSEISQDTIFKVDVHLYSFLTESDINSEPVAHKTVSLTRPRGNYAYFNVSSLVREWVRNPAKNFGIMVKAHVNGEDVVSRIDDSTDRTENMFMEVNVVEKEQQYILSKMDSIDCSLELVDLGASKNCCRFPLRVDFQSFGWDWIIAPKIYDAYYCAGSCPLTQTTGESARVKLVQSLAASDNREYGICCAPQRMKSLTIIYYNSDQEIIKTNIPEMTVERCGCT